jgi:peptidoglycan biosynthesis protein MviN/MurJ (putative lipid II flippase)
MKTRRSSGNQYAIPMWGAVVGALVLTWLHLGLDVLRDVVDSKPLAWSIYLGGLAAWWLLVVFARRAQKAAQLHNAADDASRRS